MATTFELISETTVSTPVGSVTFSSIPQTFRHLCFYISARSDSSTGSRDLTVRFNSDSATVYSMGYLYTEGTSVSGSYATSQTGALLNDTVCGSDNSAGVFSAVEFWIPNYSNSSTNKQCFDLASNRNYIVGAGGRVTAHAHKYADTSAITQVEMICQGSWETSSTIRMYGIKSA